MKQLYFIFILLTFFSCKKTLNPERKLPQGVSKLDTKASKDSATCILSYTAYSNDEACKKWTPPNKNKILKYLKRLTPIDTYTWQHCYGHFACGVKGLLLYRDTIFKYEVNAGGWISLRTKDKEYLFGSMNPKDTIQNFISVYYCNEDWD